MKVWIEILNKGAAGDSQGARDLLNSALPLALRYPMTESSNEGHYKGPLADTVRFFIGRLPEGEHPMARSRFNDFIDFVLDAILAAVERTLLLVEFCHKDPKSTVEEIAKGFPDWGGYKRGPDQKREWVAKMLRSMSAVGVPLPEVIAVAVGEDIGDRYEFDEIAYARGWNMRLAWNDFKEAQEIDYHYRCIEESDPDEEPGVATETVDYGG